MKYVVTLALMAVLVFASQAYAATVKVTNNSGSDVVAEFFGTKMVGPAKIPTSLGKGMAPKKTTTNITISNDLAISAYTIDSPNKPGDGYVFDNLPPSNAGQDHTVRIDENAQRVDIHWDQP